MKLLTIAVPCYNSAAYMKNCIESLLPGGDEVEILIVNDGSTKDNTAEIADQLQAMYPSIVRAIHQPNKGHGGAVNTGIENATGLYFKVVDSDDHLELRAYKEVLDRLREFSKEEEPVDLLISNFVYDKELENRHKVMQYRSSLPVGREFSWDEARRFRKGQYILMHSVIYRTQILRDCGMKLPEHTFYVDNMYVFEPMPYAKKLYYLDVDLYMYFIGREDQSVNEKVMIGRLDQQMRVNRLMYDFFCAPENQDILHRSEPCYNYMFNYLEIMCVISDVLANRSGTEEHLKAKEELWKYFEEKDPVLYKKLRHGIFGTLLLLPGKAGRRIIVAVYKIAQKIFNFN